MSDTNKQYQDAREAARRRYPNRSAQFQEQCAMEAAGLPVEDPPMPNYDVRQRALAEAKTRWPNRPPAAHEKYAEEVAAREAKEREHAARLRGGRKA